ncbi:hypothetical protein NDU88_004030 [Pleurodeles waltl]|uniref:Uncharacterized protein n=1 Tax=Pleurodeles waltl TaxID=8319 RepID=A0AAV7NI81_PLEWA|nr:hypothetical protein NDU88_004030 [Pleurodeles waltl]
MGSTIGPLCPARSSCDPIVHKAALLGNSLSPERYTYRECGALARLSGEREESFAQLLSPSRAARKSHDSSPTLARTW